jgi:hypothetical protein
VQLAVMDKIDGTIKTGADYNTLEYKLLNFLQTRAGTICTYVDIANGLWGSRSRKITAKELGSSAGYNSPQMHSTAYSLLHRRTGAQAQSTLRTSR